jgi:hypothetical protein
MHALHTINRLNRKAPHALVGTRAAIQLGSKRYIPGRIVDVVESPTGDLVRIESFNMHDRRTTDGNYYRNWQRA